jgi:hypothetical protein
MGNAIKVFSGRAFSAEEIELIKETRRDFKNLSLKELSSTICELIGWTMPNGKPKYMQCVGLLREMEAAGEIELPKLRQSKVVKKHAAGEAKPEDLSWMDRTPVNNCGEIELTDVGGKDKLRKWRSYMRNLHMLGDPNVHGSQKRYMIESGGRDLGCLLFSASAWALAPRDEWIGWRREDRVARLHLVVNNSRFLILPWVKVKNLASRALSAAAARIPRDWLEEYCYAPVLLETFVDDAHFKGTCYKAANWEYVGKTQGRGRNDRHTERALSVKSIYMYPLQRDFREVLKGEKPCKAVNPDER